MKQSLYLFLVLPFVLCSCGQYPFKKTDWSTYQGPGAEHFKKKETQLPLIEDDLEPMNRLLWAGNDYFVDWFFSPFAWVYRFIIPEFGRKGINNVFDNAKYPVRLVGNTFQGDFAGAWKETKCFGVDTTIGIGGLFDMSGKFEMKKSDEDFGQTLGKWGWRDSNYVFMPIVGPSSSRDLLGSLFDAALDPATYIPGATIVKGINKGSDEVDSYQHLAATNYDVYQLGRDLTSMNQSARIINHTHPVETCSQCSSTQTLGAVFFKYNDPDFPGEAKVKKVKLRKIKKELPYSLWMQPKSAPLMFVLPGLGGHRTENNSLALAEMAYRNGFSVAVISNALNFEFIQHGLSTQIPGFVPNDAYDVHVALDAIYKDLNKEHPHKITKKSLMGISMGAFHCLYIASHKESLNEDLITFDRYLAINPPVRLKYGVNKLDKYFNVFSNLPNEKEREEVEHVIGKAFQLANNKDLKPTGEVLLGDKEAQFLIGLAFRGTLQSIIFQIHNNNNNMDVLKSKWSKYDRWAVQLEISEFSFIEYMYAFVLPYYSKMRSDITNDEKGADELFRLCDLRSIGDLIKNDSDIHIVTNQNDFLLANEDVDWLKNNFKENYFNFEGGGHLGNLYMPEVQNKVMAPVLDLAKK